MSNQLTEVEELKLIYQEIINGSSFCPEQGYYVKHFNELDNINILRKRIAVYQNYLKSGVPNEKEKLKESIEHERWSQGQEDSILNLRYIISDNERNLPSLIPEQQPTIKKIILEKKKELLILISQRRDALGLTAEEASEKDVYYFVTFSALFKDGECQTPFFDSMDVFEELDEEVAASHSDVANTILSKFNEQNIKKISVLPFFLNTFSYSKEAIQSFLNKPMVKLTNYQMLLFSLGSRNINILSQAQGEPPELLGDIIPSQIVDWYDQQYSLILGRRNTR